MIHPRDHETDTWDSARKSPRTGSGLDMNPQFSWCQTSFLCWIRCCVSLAELALAVLLNREEGCWSFLGEEVQGCFLQPFQAGIPQQARSEVGTPGHWMQLFPLFLQRKESKLQLLISYESGVQKEERTCNQQYRLFWGGGWMGESRNPQFDQGRVGHDSHVALM